MAVAPDNDSFVPLVTGGYDCKFVETPPDSLHCPVCLLPFRDPSLPSCCGHKGCASCLGRVKAAGHPCPMCQQPFTMVLDKYFQRKMLDLRVYCSKKEEGCGWKGELRHLQTHSQSDCGHVEVECRYKCGGRYQRRLLQNHEMDECRQRPPEVITQSRMRKMAERMDKLEAAHQGDRTKLAAVEMAYQENQAKLSQQIQGVQQENTSLQDEKRKMTRKIDELESRLQLVEKTHREDHEKQSHQIYEQKRENALIQDEKRKLMKKVDELECQLQQHSAHLSLVPVNGPSWLIDEKGMLSSPYPPCQIIMPRFSQHKRDDDIWYSQPFYSAPGGYKLCLKVTANGRGLGAGTHISVFVHLMKGENDEKLKFPFVHDVKYGILNWKRDDNHQIKDLYFKNAGGNFNGRVTLREMSEYGMGSGAFLPHSSLGGDAARNIQYLNADYLCLQVLKIELPK